jgi:hypothetical protein
VARAGFSSSCKTPPATWEQRRSDSRHRKPIMMMSLVKLSRNHIIPRPMVFFSFKYLRLAFCPSA